MLEYECERGGRGLGLFIKEPEGVQLGCFPAPETALHKLRLKRINCNEGIYY